MSEENGSIITAPSLIGKKIYLRPIKDEDKPLLSEWKLLAEPQALSCHPQDFMPGQTSAERLQRKISTLTGQQLAVVRKKDDTLLGNVTYFNYNSLNRSAELGVLIAPNERKKGYAKAAVFLLMRYLFRLRGLNKVYAQTAQFNKASIKLLEGLGFKRDAVLRNHYFYNGEFYAGYIYSLLLFEFE